MANPLRIYEGIFQKREGDFLIVPDTGKAIRLSEALSEFEGEEVSLQVHHFPPIPPLPQPGGGSCLWPPGMCPHGHAEDPAWMYARDCEGVLIKKKTDWSIDDGQPLFTPMEGHRGRLVLFCEKVTAGKSDTEILEGLLSEAGTLMSQFEALKKAMGEP